MIRPAEVSSLLDFLRRAERLKDTVRSGYTSGGRQESVADHTWRLCLMALLLHERFPDVDFAHLVKICVVHDLGEAIGGDIPAPEQAAVGAKADQERRDLLDLLSPLPEHQREEIAALWDEYEAASSPEARLAKALDKLETLLQHTQGANPSDFDYRFNLEYGRQYTTGDPTIEAIRQVLDEETERRAMEEGAGRSLRGAHTCRSRVGGDSATGSRCEVVTDERVDRERLTALDQQIDLDDPTRPDVLALLVEHLRNMRELSPPESVHALDVEGLMAPEVTFWTVRREGVLLGCGALKELGPEHGEIKSMRTPVAHRRLGAGRAILEHILSEARSRGYRRVSLETGSMEEFAPARRLYESYGFHSCGPFAGYAPDPNSTFMTLEL